MKTKLFASLLILIMVFPQTFAQKIKKTDIGIQFEILGGCRLQTFIGTDYWGEKLNNDLIIGFHGGGKVIFHIGPDLYIQPVKEEYGIRAFSGVQVLRLPQFFYK